MKNILIPTDFSENSWNAIKYAEQLFEYTKCNFYLIHVSDFINSAMYEVSYDEDEILQINKTIAPSSSKAQLSDLHRNIEKAFENKNHNFFYIHENGFFLEAIKKHISENKIDLIIMGTTGATGMRESILGSNSGDVITKVKCNTLIIPKGVTFSVPQEVAFATDYNIFCSHKILEAVTEMLGLCQGNIRVMNVSKANRLLTMAQERNREYLYDYLNETFDKNNSFHTITNKSVNNAIQHLVESRDIDMIIMVAKNLNFIQQILFDSLSEKISFHTSVPFFVIHE